MNVIDRLISLGYASHIVCLERESCMQKQPLRFLGAFGMALSLAVLPLFAPRIRQFRRVSPV